MTEEVPGATQTYKIKLTSGRILGPVDLERIRLLILKNQIVGSELARVYPEGEWQDINGILPIGELLIAKIAGTLVSEETAQTDYQPILGGNAGYANTVVLSVPGTLPGAGSYNAPLPELKTDSRIAQNPSKATAPTQANLEVSSEDESEKTIVASLDGDDDRTMVAPAGREFQREPQVDLSESESHANEGEGEIQFEGSSMGPITHSYGTGIVEARNHHISNERTVVFQRADLLPDMPNTSGEGRRKKRSLTPLIVLLALIGVGSEFIFPDLGEKKKGFTRPELVRPKLPSYVAGNSDPLKSMEIYAEGIKFYLEDTDSGYRASANRFRRSVELDAGNVKALAMLSSSYLNLIDSSNKDENYFSVLSKLIDMSRAKNVDLSETVIADVEFYLVINKAEAAQNRIAEYTKSHPTYGMEMFYYLALAFYSRGDANSAARYIGQLPDNKPFSAKVFYLKGQIAEKLKDIESAMREYRMAIAFNPRHAKSHLKIATLLSNQGMLKEAKKNVTFLIENLKLMNPPEIAQTYYLHAQIAELNHDWDLALGDMERAVKLDPDNHDMLLELYTLRGKAGENPAVVQKFARMYYFLGEGERLIKSGKYEDAKIPLLEAGEANRESPLPPLRMGDVFTYLHDLDNARLNYKLAAQRAPTNIQVWSKYIQSLIQTYEWEEATKAMDKFRKLPVSQSAIDKAAADIMQKQGRITEAQMYYRKAMSRDSIDPDVYLAYAKSLMSVKNFKDAPFFFALALRFDPLNIEAIISTAKCVAETESIERGISMLQDELNQREGARAELLVGIAELQIQKGDWDAARKSVNEALQTNPDFPLSYRLQGQIHMSHEATDKEALNKALEAYKSYSDRNPSDPSGYLERYKILARKAQYDQAYEELKRVYEIYPKYPQLHFFLGALYAVQGNHKASVEEFQKELINNPNQLQTLMAYGRELLELGAAQEALNQFNKAMRIAPNSSEAKHYAGWASRATKNYDAGIALMRSAITLDPGNPLLYKRLGIIFRESGNMGQACNAFKKYLEMEPDAQDKDEFQGCK